MRGCLTALALTASACSPMACSSSTVLPPTTTVTSPPTREPDLSAVLSLVGRFGIAHACPVSPTLALTAAHVVDLRPFDSGVQAWPYVWSDRRGNVGMVAPSGLSDSRDLALLRTSKPFPAPYRIASGAPLPGTLVWVLGFETRSARHAYGPRVWAFKVLRVVSGHLVLDGHGTPGSSGSCALNAAGEVVAINIGSLPLDEDGAAGIAVGVWPDVFELPE